MHVFISKRHKEIVSTNYRELEHEHKCKNRKYYSPMGNHTPSLRMEQELQNFPTTHLLSHPPPQL